jgi:hypothetical protein
MKPRFPRWLVFAISLLLALTAAPKAHACLNATEFEKPTVQTVAFAERALEAYDYKTAQDLLASYSDEIEHLTAPPPDDWDGHETAWAGCRKDWAQIVARSQPLDVRAWYFSWFLC